MLFLVSHALARRSLIFGCGVSCVYSLSLLPPFPPSPPSSSSLYQLCPYMLCEYQCNPGTLSSPHCAYGKATSLFPSLPLPLSFSTPLPKPLLSVSPLLLPCPPYPRYCPYPYPYPYFPALACAGEGTRSFYRAIFSNGEERPSVRVLGSVGLGPGGKRAP